MTRTACVMMFRDEALLLRPWLLYHGYLFGFENLFLLADPAAQDVSAIVQAFAALGVSVETGGSGALLEAKVEAFRQADRYDVVLPLNDGEFLAVNGPEGISCHRTHILDALERVGAGGVTCRTAFRLHNQAGCFDLFRYEPHARCVLAVRGFLGIDAALAEAVMPGEQRHGSTDLFCLCLQDPPFTQVLERTMRAMAPQMAAAGPALDRLAGVDASLLAVLCTSAPEYYAVRSANAQPMLRFRGLARVLGVFMDVGALRAVWEAGRPAGPPDDLIEVDLDRTPYSDSSYEEANPDLQGHALLAHFITAGFREGRAVGRSAAAVAEVIERMAMIRIKQPDGVSGFENLAEFYDMAGRLPECEELLRGALATFGENLILLTEFARVHVLQDRFAEAAEICATLRTRFPDDWRGYVIGVQAWQFGGAPDRAEQILLSAMEKWPHDVTYRMFQAELVADAGHAARARSLWNIILLSHPGNSEVRQRASASLFNLRLLGSGDDDGGDLDDLDEPVSVAMTATETRQALAFLRLADVAELRAFFMQFESLGFNCEFGLVQRRYGAEPISLLRWSNIGLPDLITMLQARFTGLGDPEDLHILDDGEFIISSLRYGLAMHTFIRSSTTDSAALHPRMAKRMGYLGRKIVVDLQAAEKCFVFLDKVQRSDQEILQLHAALRQYGPVRLLYVRAADHPSRIGGVEEIAVDCLCGYLQHRGEITGSWAIDFDGWLSVCQGAVAHWRAKMAAA